MRFSPVTVFLASIAVSHARPSLEIRRRAQVITRCTVPKTVALTFDDGPYKYIYDITAQLKAANATATFFFNGNNYGCIYNNDNVQRVEHAFNAGHQIASHTWSHTDLTKLSWDKVNSEMQKIDQAIQRITGAIPSFLRPPYGKYNDRVLQVAASRKQSIVLWDLDSGDSVGASVSAQQGRYTKVMNARPKTILALNHETYASTARDVLPHALKQLRSAGYRMVSVAECLGQKPYQSKGKPAVRDASWRC